MEFLWFVIGFCAGIAVAFTLSEIFDKKDTP